MTILALAWMIAGIPALSLWAWVVLHFAYLIQWAFCRYDDRAFRLGWQAFVWPVTFVIIAALAVGFKAGPSADAAVISAIVGFSTDVLMSLVITVFGMRMLVTASGRN